MLPPIVQKNFVDLVNGYNTPATKLFSPTQTVVMKSTIMLPFEILIIINFINITILFDLLL